MWGFCVGLSFGMHYFMSFLVLQSSGRRTESWFALLLLSFGCLVTVNVLWLLLTVGAVGWCVIVVFPDHTHLLFERENKKTF